MKTVVIGGGPAGMMAAISAASCGNETILIEKNSSLGKKLLITGKGRCNITSMENMSNFISNIPGNGKFLYSAFKNYTNIDIINFLRENGLDVKVERGKRVFPVTDKSKDVLDCFIKELKSKKVKIKCNQEVVKIKTEEGCVKGVYLSDGSYLDSEKVIIATGGKSYPKTGSNGNGYKLASSLGHTIIKPRGSIVPLMADTTICKPLQGLSLKNVSISIKDTLNNKAIYEDFGEMLFTHFGVSGPIILSSSAHLVRYKDIDSLFKSNDIKLYIDLKPALTYEELDKRILRDFKEFSNRSFKNSLGKLLPKKMIDTIVLRSGIDPNKETNLITHEERTRLIKLLKNFDVNLKGFRPIDEAIITAGGVSTKEINPKTMESKLVKGLFFAGEVIDVDAYTGGFNLQIAYSTGHSAGMNG